MKGPDRSTVSVIEARYDYGAIVHLMRLCLTFLRAFQARNQTPIASNALVNHARRVYPAQLKRSFLTTEMKRQAIKDPAGAPKAKKAREEEPAYHLTPSVKDELGEIVWPARGNEMENARKIIIEWSVQTS